MLVSDSLPADRHFVANPDDIFDKVTHLQQSLLSDRMLNLCADVPQPTEDLLVDVENRVVLEGHIQCAAHEMPIHIVEDEQYFGPLLKNACANLTRDQEGWYAGARNLIAYALFLTIFLCLGITPTLDISLILQVMSPYVVLERKSTLLLISLTLTSQMVGPRFLKRLNYRAPCSR